MLENAGIIASIAGVCFTILFGLFKWFGGWLDHRQALRDKAIYARLDNMEEAQKERDRALNVKTSKLEEDFRGFIIQFQNSRHENDMRFLPRTEHDASVNRLDSTLAELNRNVVRLTDRLNERLDRVLAQGRASTQ